MSELEKFVFEQIKKLVPVFDSVELRANIGDTSYAVEFVVSTNGEKMQCYDMVDNGLLNEEELDNTIAVIAKAIRETPEYQKGKVNKMTVTIVQQ